MYKVLLLILLLSSCSAQKRCERKLRKAEKLGCLSYASDTLIIRDTIKGENIYIEVGVKPDSAALEKELAKIKDSCISKETIRNVFTRIPCVIIPYEKDTATYNLKIWIDDGVIKFDLKIKPRILERKVITKTKVVSLTPSWKKYLNWTFFVLLLAGFIYLLKKIFL